MTPSIDNRRIASAALIAMDRLLDEQLLFEQVNAPIDQVAADFTYPRSDRPDPHQFMTIVARFVRHIYRHGLRPARIMSLAIARIESVELLHSHYEGRVERGLEAACVEGCCLTGGVKQVLDGVADAIKRCERQHRVSWARARCIDGQPWPVRVEMARIILDRFQSDIPAQLPRLHPEGFADMVAELYDYEASCRIGT